jgi:two-component system, LytTR family, sensor kinase
MRWIAIVLFVRRRLTRIRLLLAGIRALSYNGYRKPVANSIFENESMPNEVITLKDRIVVPRVVGHSLFWIAVLGYGLVENWTVSANKQAILEVYLTKLPVQMLLAYSITYFLLPRFLLRGAYVQFVIILFVSAYFVSIGNSYYRAFYAEAKYPTFYRSQTVHSAAMYYSFTKFLMYITSFYTPAAIMGLIKLVRTQHKKEQQREAIEKQMLLAEMTFLKNQLNPHFLFNTLNNLYMLTLKASPQAPEVVARLSETLDYMLYRCSEHAVPVQGEIQLIENYLALERLRLNDDVQINFTAPKNPGTATIAPLIMLSLVENAFKHGVNKGIGHVMIAVDLQVTESKLIFSVTNTKAPSEDATPPGIGLKNIRRQLELMYPGKHNLSIDDTRNQYKVDLQILSH